MGQMRMALSVKLPQNPFRNGLNVPVVRAEIQAEEMRTPLQEMDEDVCIVERLIKKG